MTELVKLTQEQHEFIKTFYIDGYAVDKIDKAKAIHYISRWGFGFPLTDGNGEEYSYFRPDGEERKPAPFEKYECFKIIDAIISGYEVIEQRYHLYTESYNEITGNIGKAYYLGQPYRMRITSPEEKLKTDWGKTFSLDEANKIIADFKELGVTLEIEKINEC